MSERATQPASIGPFVDRSQRISGVGRLIVLAFGLPIVAYGLIFSWWLCLLGGAIIVTAMFGWAFEPPDDPEAAHGHGHGVAGHDDHGSAADVDALEQEVAPVG